MYTYFSVLLCFLAATFLVSPFFLFSLPPWRREKSWIMPRAFLMAAELCLIMAFGAGPWSVDGWIGRRQEEAEEAEAAE